MSTFATELASMMSDVHTELGHRTITLTLRTEGDWSDALGRHEDPDEVIATITDAIRPAGLQELSGGTMGVEERTWTVRNDSSNTNLQTIVTANGIAEGLVITESSVEWRVVRVSDVSGGNGWRLTARMDRQPGA